MAGGKAQFATERRRQTYFCDEERARCTTCRGGVKYEWASTARICPAAAHASDVASSTARTVMSDLSETLGVATYRKPNGRVVIRLVGSLDVAGAARLMDEVTQSDPGIGNLVELHLEDVTFIDSAGIGALIYAEAFTKSRGGDFAISSPSRRASAALKQAGLDRHVAYDDRRDDDPTRSARHGAATSGPRFHADQP